MYDYDEDVAIAEQEIKKNKRSLRKLSKNEDFVLYTDTADNFDLSEVTGSNSFGIGFSDDY